MGTTWTHGVAAKVIRQTAGMGMSHKAQTCGSPFALLNCLQTVCLPTVQAVEHNCACTLGPWSTFTLSSKVVTHHLL